MRPLQRLIRLGFTRPSEAAALLRLLAADRRLNRETRAVMRRALDASSNCVDVGCHSGSILRDMVRLAPGGTHWAFEPIPALHAELVRRFPSVHVSGVALSDRPGTSEFRHVITKPMLSGFRERSETEGETVEILRVRTAPLDEVRPVDLPVRLVKVDVEGAELQVLRGALGTLRRHRPFVLFEHGLGAADRYGTEPEQVHDLLAGDVGLRVTLMSRWLRGQPPFGREEFADAFRAGRAFFFLAHP
jgi:FkbM family methyltransferase